jgi:hypothetical protein
MLTHRRNTRGAARLLTLGAGIAALLAFAAPVAAANPAGNNGTVKIDRLAFDDAPNNEPHVGCIFQVDFYGFDAGDLSADVIFEAHPPTGSGLLLEDGVFIGEDNNSGGGSEAGLDASRTYDLTEALASYTPHPQQGWHVKLTVHAEGSQGADTKHKVFWVEGCEQPGTPPSNPPSNPPGNPPSNPLGNPPHSGTLGGAGGPKDPALPDTALAADGETALTLLAGLLLLGGSGTYAAVAIRDRSRRR